MSMSDEVRSTLSGLVAPAVKRGESIVAEQVAMASDCGGRQTMWTGDAGSPIGGLLSGMQEETETGAWAVRPFLRGVMGG